MAALGQDGSLLLHSLLAQGLEVVSVSRSSNPNLATHRELGIAGELELTTADLCDFREIHELYARHQPYEVFNLADQSSVGLSFRQPVDIFNRIINSTINLLEVSRFASFKGRIYFAGSSEMFGNTDQPADVYIRRTPLSPYAIAKDGSFNTVQLYREAYGLRCVTGILINHESPYRSGAFVTRKIVEGALRCKREPGYRLQLGNLDMARDWGWAEEYVDAMQILVRADQLADKVIYTGRMETLEYFVDLVFTQLGLNWHDCVELKESLRWPSEILRSVSNPEPMAQRHGWRAERDVDAVVDALLGYSRVPNT